MRSVSRQSSVKIENSRLTSHDSRKQNSERKVQVSDTTEAEKPAAVGFQTKNR